jgi:hypothetical protein
MANPRPSNHVFISALLVKPSSLLPVKMESQMKKSQSNQIIKLLEMMLQWEQGQSSLMDNFQRQAKYAVR